MHADRPQSVMTLLVAYASTDVVVTATDRMITWTCRDAATSVDHEVFREHATKTLLVDGRFLVTFSGVADVAGSTERWLIDVFAEVSASPDLSGAWGPYVVKRLQEGLAALVSPTRPATGLWISLMVVGYQAERPGDDVEPFLVVISNSDEKDYGSSRTSNYREFWHDSLSVPTRQAQSFLWAVGSTPKIAKVVAAAELIRLYRRGASDRWREISRTLAQLVVDRSVEVEGKGVGSTVQVTVLPRSALGVAMLSYAALPAPLNEPIALEYNSRVENDSVLQNGINVVSHGMATFDVVIGHGDEPMSREPFLPPPC